MTENTQKPSVWNRFVMNSMFRKQMEPTQSAADRRRAKTFECVTCEAPIPPGKAGRQCKSCNTFTRSPPVYLDE